MQVICKQVNILSLTPYGFNSNKIPSCHTLSKALEISRKTPVTSIIGSQSGDEFISWTIENNCEINKSPEEKPD